MKELPNRLAGADGKTRHCAPCRWGRSTTFATAFLGLVAAAFAARLDAQDSIEPYLDLRINEILADNETIFPQNWRCVHRDLLELYNGSDETLALDNPALGRIRITDHSTGLDGKVRYLDFTGLIARRLEPGQRLVIFCDEEPFDDDVARDPACEEAKRNVDILEIHAPWRLDNEGETVTLEFVPLADPTNPVVLHEVTYPPLVDDVSFARFPEDADNLESWVFTKQPTFGSCVVPLETGAPACVGEANQPGDPIEPDVELIDYATNSPAPGEDALFRARVTDEKVPDPSNIQAVRIHFRVDSGSWQEVEMEFVELLTESDNPLDKWSLWEGAIPGSFHELGGVVEFYLSATDSDSLSDTDPREPICDLGIGPCDPLDPVEELGPGCSLGEDCRPAERYTVGSTYSGPLVINEVVPSNRTILMDPTEELNLCNPPGTTTCRFDDFIEIYNASSLNVSLEGLVLARGPFAPERGWTFRPGSEIGPRQYLIVWLDGDDEDPDPTMPIDPDKNPANPNNPAAGEHHTDFTIDAGRDEVFLFDTQENGYQLIDGVRWGTSGRYFIADDTPPVVPPLEFPAFRGIRESVSGVDPVGTPLELGLVRSPDGRRDSAWFLLEAESITPGARNEAAGLEFRRGDVDSNGALDISDPITNLQYQFLGIGNPACLDALDFDDNGRIEITDPINSLGHQFLGHPPPAPPGKETCGPDPTPDDLGDCASPTC